jgi:hypothetical protein
VHAENVQDTTGALPMTTGLYWPTAETADKIRRLQREGWRVASGYEFGRVNPDLGSRNDARFVMFTIKEDE